MLRTGHGLKSERLVLLALCCACSIAHAGDALYYEHVDGELVITNVTGDGLKPVPGFAPQARGRLAAARVTLPVSRYDRFIEHAAAEFNLSADLIKAVAVVESGLNPRARSPKGAQGLMQLMPATARSYGVRDPYDPFQNLRAGARHLSHLLDQFDGDRTLALAAYNAGATAVQRHGGVPAYRETRNYVRKVEALLEGGSGAPTARAPQRAAVGDPARIVRLADGSIALVN